MERSFPETLSALRKGRNISQRQAAADLGMRQRGAGKWFVFTPHAQAQLEPCSLLLSGEDRDPDDTVRFADAWGGNVHDPCYSGRFGKQKANYRF